jgi:hypothetical protein
MMGLSSCVKAFCNADVSIDVSSAFSSEEFRTLLTS